MTIYNTTDSNIIFIHNDYKKIKQITQRMKDLKMRLLNEKIIKESQNYIVFTNDKFSYTSYIKFKKAFIRDYISDDYEAYNNIDKKYYKYWLDDNELIHSNNQKYSLLVDYMCHTGDIISIDRHGLSKLDLDPISKASFETTMGNFVNSAIFNEKDTMKSLSSRIALGRVFNGGTGSFELLLDTKK